MNIANNITELIGRTPLVKLNSISGINDTVIVGKIESMNPGGSVKDRIGLSMIIHAEQKGLIDKDTVIIEPTSGNTGIALAMICASRGYKLVITMPESMSPERMKILKGYDAEVVATPAHEGMQGAIDEAFKLTKRYKKVFIPQQFNNPSNPEAHRIGTAKEIWEDTDGKVDIFVAGIGTGGTFTGVSEELKKKKPEIKTIAVEPKDSSVISGGNPGPHKIQGIGAGFIPKVLNREMINDIVLVSNNDAIETARQIIKNDGISCGISSGAAVYASKVIAEKAENKGKMIIVILPDSAERYLSTTLF